MKKLLPILLAVASLVALAPSSHAYDKDPWQDIKQILDDLNPRMDGVNAKGVRYGGSREVRAEVHELNEGIRAVTIHLSRRDMDPKLVYDRARSLADLMTRVEGEYRSHIEHVRNEERRDRW